MMPVVDASASKVTDIAAWNGGGYAVTNSSAVKEEAIKLLNYMFKPDNWSKVAWENGVCMSAQNYSDFLTGNETDVLSIVKKRELILLSYLMMMRMPRMK
jgi:raffinose/stachyose/melibiose transport system substrate-binding protein